MQDPEDPTMPAASHSLAPTGRLLVVRRTEVAFCGFLHQHGTGPGCQGCFAETFLKEGINWISSYYVQLAAVASNMQKK